MNRAITFFHPSSELYGADKILLYIMDNYPQYKKTVILKTDGPLVSLIKEKMPEVSIEIIHTMPVIAKKNMTPSGIFEFLISLFKFAKFLKTNNIDQMDILYINTLAVLPILFLARKMKAIRIIHVHEILKNNSIIHKVINKLAIKYCDLCICVSNAVKNNLQEISGNLASKLSVVYNGISFSSNIEKKEQLFEINTDKLNFSLIGRIKPTHKGQNLLLDAISLIPKHFLDKIHFYFVGDPVPGQESMLDEVKNKIKQLNLSDSVTIIPFMKNIGDIYPFIDVVVVPSVFDDPFPTTVLEGMYFSKPVIGTNVGGIPEMIQNNITGFIVERDSAYELSKKIIYFIENEPSISNLGEKGKLVFEKNFSVESFNQRYLTTINKVI